MASQEWLAVFCRLWRKNEHKETRVGYKIRILGQNVQARIRDLFGNRRIKMENKIKHENLINENESIFLGRLWKKYKDMQDEEEICPQDLVNSFVDEKAKVDIKGIYLLRKR